MTEFSMDAVAAALRAAGRAADVQHSGGGCATIYAGESYIDAAGDERYQIFAGPGAFSWDADEDSLANTDDFYIGPDDNGASGDFDNARDLGAYPPWTIEAMLATEIARQLEGFVWPAGAHQRIGQPNGDYDPRRDDRKLARRREGPFAVVKEL